MRWWIISLGMLLAATAAVQGGPYPPSAGEAGSTAIHMDSPLYIAWASGWTNYQVGAECSTSFQTPGKAVGKPDGVVTSIVCLGRGGQITMTFDVAIHDGPGFDFAIFENAFVPFASFLELAYVEVSSDGTNFTRFPNDSLTANEVESFGVIDCTDVDGLAGKYRLGYGTPFDLQVLTDASPLLDLENITWVRLVDIVGDGSAFDSDGDIIYDPYPTVGSAGFDLQGIGVINSPTRCTIERQATGAAVMWFAFTNRVYQVEYCDLGGDGGWLPLGDAMAGNNSVHTVVDTNASPACRVYRALRSMVSE